MPLWKTVGPVLQRTVEQEEMMVLMKSSTGPDNLTAHARLTLSQRGASRIYGLSPAHFHPRFSKLEHLLKW